MPAGWDRCRRWRFRARGKGTRHELRAEDELRELEAELEDIRRRIEELKRELGK